MTDAFAGMRLVVIAEDNEVRLTMGSLTMSVRPAEARKLGQLLLDAADISEEGP